MAEVSITAEMRTDLGRSGARMARRQGKVPAVLYGGGIDPQHLLLPAHDLAKGLKKGSGTLLRLETDKGAAKLALPKALQRDPLRGNLIHIDLLLVRAGERVRVEVPVRVVGEPADGMVQQILSTLAVTAEATHIPSGIEVDLSDSPIGTAIHAGEVTLPVGVSLDTPADALVVNIISGVIAETEAPEGEGGAAQEAAEAASGESAGE